LATIEENKEKFIKIYEENIKREGADKLLEYLKATDCFTAPASTRYHGNYEGGLCAHSINTYERFVELVDKYSETKYSDEVIAICGLLHDICKVQFYKKGFRNVKNEDTGKWDKKEIYEISEGFPCGHSEKSIILLQAFIKLETDSILAIRAHMGAFDATAKSGDYLIGNIFEKCKLAVLLHQADLLATYISEAKTE
jgi:hypothetical protein